MFGTNRTKAADDRAGQPADAADHEADEQRDREREGEAVRRDELHRDGAERAGDAGDAGADAEGQRLVERDIDAHRARRDRVVADRHQGAAGAALTRLTREDVDHDRDREREVVEPLVLATSAGRTARRAW